jgi:hypothetical protein
MTTTFMEEPKRSSAKEQQSVNAGEQAEGSVSFRTIGELATFVQSFTAKIIEAWSINGADVDYFPGVYLADVDEGLSRFRSELEIAQLRDNTIVCASFEDDIPVPADSRAILAAAGQEQSSFQVLMSQNRPWLSIDTLNSVIEDMGLEPVVVSSDKAIEFFQHHLSRFIFFRFLGSTAISANRDIGPPPLPYPPGHLQFRVYAQNSGLRIRYSPAFLMGSGAVFGSAPPMPVDGWLRPSAYIFGGEDSSGLRWDRGIYDLPPATEAHLLIP